MKKIFFFFLKDQMKKREHGLLYAAHGAADGLICVRYNTTIQDMIFLLSKKKLTPSV